MVRLGEGGEAALGRERDALGRNGLLDGVERLVEPDAEARVVPADVRAPLPREEEPEVALRQEAFVRRDR